MGFDVWKTGVKAKIGLLKADIVGNYREKETNRYIRKTKQEANPSIVTTKEHLEYYLKKKYNLIYIEGELYHEMEQKDYKKILNSFGKTMSKIGKNTALVSGVVTAGMSPFTIPLALSSMFLGVISKSDLDNYEYIIDKNVPIINKINPASMITDGFYSLYYYDTLDRFYFNLASLLIFSGIMIIISYISLRRQKYDSI